MNQVYFKSSDEISAVADRVVELEKSQLLRVLLDADIQHIGSTSIPGSITKGDVDICIRVTKDNFNNAVTALKELYDINQAENWTSEFASFKDDDKHDLPLGVQLVIKNSKEDVFSKVRDLVKKSPDLLEEYNRMKQSYEGKDMTAYQDAKSEFFEKVTKQIT